MTTDIIRAIQDGEERRVASLLDANPDLLAARNEQGVSAVSLAMYFGRPEIARAFVERGAQLDIFDAAAVGSLERVGALVEREPALTNASSPDGFQPLGLAAFFGHIDIVRFLLQHGADVNAAAQNQMKVCPIHAAAARNDSGIVRLLLEHGADPNTRQQQGYAALHSAAQNGNLEVVELLLANGAAPSAAAEDGKTPADIAESRGHIDIARMLRTKTGA